LRVLRALGDAFSYFSILPLRSSESAPDDAAIAFLPLVGLVIGALAGYAAYGIGLLTHSQLAAAIAAWVLSIALSGAIHVDGFLDCCDGLFAMAPPEKRLEIMRDPHHGSYAIVGMAILSVLWLYALAQVPATIMPAFLPIVGFLGRLAVAVVRTRAAIAVGVVPLAVVFFWPPRFAAIVLVGIGILTTGIVTIFARHRLGGVLSGDCYGAAIVVTEVGLLLTYPALALLR